MIVVKGEEGDRYSSMGNLPVWGVQYRVVRVNADEEPVWIWFETISRVLDDADQRAKDLTREAAHSDQFKAALLPRYMRGHGLPPPVRTRYERVR